MVHRPTTTAPHAAAFDRELRHLIDLWLTREETRARGGSYAERARLAGALQDQRSRVAAARTSLD